MKKLHIVVGILLLATPAFAAQKKSARSVAIRGSQSISDVDLSHGDGFPKSNRFNLGAQISPNSFFSFWGAEFTGHFNVAPRIDVGFESGLLASFPAGFSIFTIPVMGSARYQVIPMNKKFSFNVGLGLGMAFAFGGEGVGGGVGFMGDIRPVLGYDRFYFTPKLAFGTAGVNFAAAVGAQF